MVRLSLMFILGGFHRHPQFVNYEGHWGTTDDFVTSFLQRMPVVPVLHCPLGLAELQARPFPDVVFPPLPLYALFSPPPPPLNCALQDFVDQT